MLNRDVERREFAFLTSEHHAEIYRHIRARLEKYGGLPGLAKREKERCAHNLARKYGVPEKMILKSYDRAVARRLGAERIRQREAFKARTKPGTLTPTGGDIPTTRDR